MKGLHQRPGVSNTQQHALRNCIPTIRPFTSKPTQSTPISHQQTSAARLLTARASAAPAASVVTQTEASAPSTTLPTSEDNEDSRKSTAYPFTEIELKWQAYWEENKTFRTPEEIDTSKPKYYVLDMFPYPR